MTTGDWILVGGAALGAYLLFGRGAAGRSAPAAQNGLAIPLTQDALIGYGAGVAKEKLTGLWDALGGGSDLSTPPTNEAGAAMRAGLGITGATDGRVRYHTIIDASRPGVQTYTAGGVTHTTNVRVVG